MKDEEDDAFLGGISENNQGILASQTLYWLGTIILDHDLKSVKNTTQKSLQQIIGLDTLWWQDLHSQMLSALQM